MTVSSKFERQKKYKGFFLPAVSALAVAHVTLCLEQSVSPIKVIFIKDYPLQLVCSYIIALSVFYAVNLVSWKLDQSYTWESRKWKRLGLQFLAGILGALALEIILTGLYFSVGGRDIFDIVFYDRHFFMILGYIVAINMYYHAEAIVYWKTYGSTSVPVKPSIELALQIYLKQHDVVLIYTHDDSVFAKTSKGDIMTWDFRLSSTIMGLDPKLYFRASRYHIVRRDAIDHIHLNPLKLLLTIYLKEPFNDQIRVPRTSKDQFTAWWYSGNQLPPSVYYSF